MFLKGPQGLCSKIRSHVGATVTRPISPRCKGVGNGKH